MDNLIVFIANKFCKLINKYNNSKLKTKGKNKRV